MQGCDMSVETKKMTPQKWGAGGGGDKKKVLVDNKLMSDAPFKQGRLLQL